MKDRGRFVLPRNRSSPDSENGWGQFPDTLLHFAEPPGFTVDLREPISEGDIETFRAVGLGATFGVITAEDPFGRAQGDVENQRATTQLRRDLGELGCGVVDVDACNRDRSHCEQSMAVATGLQPLITLAFRYDQLAIFWFDGEAFWIVPALTQKGAARLPV